MIGLSELLPDSSNGELRVRLDVVLVLDELKRAYGGHGAGRAHVEEHNGRAGRVEVLSSKHAIVESS